MYNHFKRHKINVFCEHVLFNKRIAAKIKNHAENIKSRHNANTIIGKKDKEKNMHAQKNSI